MIANDPRFVNQLQQVRAQRAAQRPIQIVSNLQEEEEEEKNDN
jgi:hypothetical protein